MKIILSDKCTNDAKSKLINQLDDLIISTSGKVLSLRHELLEDEQLALSSKYQIIEYFTNDQLPLVARAKSVMPELFEKFTVIAGPCSIESHEQMTEIAAAVAKSGAVALRGGAFKPRTSTYDFQGLGLSGLMMMSEVAKKHQLLVVSEVTCIGNIKNMSPYVDIFQVGARNMQNFALLKALGQQSKPVLLKRAASATYFEFLAAAEYILAEGNSQVILCERGTKSFEPQTRNTLDLSIVPILRQFTKLPIIVDPSHAVGVSCAVPSLAKAAVAVGADGIMLEIHPEPEKSVSDAKQALSLTIYQKLILEINKIIAALA